MSWSRFVLIIALAASVLEPHDCLFAAPSAQQLADEMQQRYGSVRALDVRWTCKTTLQLKMKSPDLLNFRGRAMDQYAIKGERRSRQYTIPILSNRTGEVEQTRFVFDGKATLSQLLRHCGDPSHLTLRDNYYIEIGGDQGTPGQMEQSVLYLESLGSPAYNGRLLEPWRRQCVRDGKMAFKEEPDRPFSVVQALRKGAYQVEDAKQTIQGTECWVVKEPGKDELWIDAKCYVVVRRNWYWREGHVMVSYENRNFAESADGLCWPKSATRTWYVDSVRYPELSPTQVHFVDELTVNTLSTQDIDEELFVSVPAPGSTIMNNSLVMHEGKPKFVSYVVGNTPEATQRALQERLSRAESSRRGLLWHSPLTSWRNLLILINALAIVTLLVVLIVRKMRGAQA